MRDTLESITCCLSVVRYASLPSQTRAERIHTEISLSLYIYIMYLTVGVDLGKRQHDLHRGWLEGVQHRPPRLLSGDPSFPLCPAAN